MMNILTNVIILLLAVGLILKIGKYLVAFVWCSYQRRRPIPQDAPKAVPKEKKRLSAAAKLKQGVTGFFDGCTRYAMTKAGRIPSFKLRKFLYKTVFCMKIAKGAIIYAQCEFRSPWYITIGKCTIGPQTVLDGRRGLVLGDYACTGNGAKIWTLQHDVQDPMFSAVGGKVEIGEYAWVASHATVLPGRKVGKGAVIASGSIVTKDAEPYGLYAGIPAVKKGERNKELRYTLDADIWFV